MTYEEKLNFINKMVSYEQAKGFDEHLSDLQDKLSVSGDIEMKTLFVQKIKGANENILFKKKREEKVEPTVVKKIVSTSESAHSMGNDDNPSSSENSTPVAPIDLTNSRYANKLEDVDIALINAQQNVEKMSKPVEVKGFVPLKAVNKKTGTNTNSPLTASLLAAAFAIGGCAVFALTFYLGFISGWIAALTVFLAGLGYKKIRGVLDKKGVVICSIITIVEIAITLLLCYTGYVYTAFEGALTFTESFSELLVILGDEPNLKLEFIMNGLLSIVFTIIGIVIYYTNLNRDKLKLRKSADKEIK